MFASNVALSLSCNFFASLPKGQARTYRGYMKPTVPGAFPWRFTYSNAVDSTWADGAVSRAGMPGGAFRILHAAVCACDGQRHVLETRPVTWQGQAQKDAAPSEVFACDPVSLSVPQGGYVMFEWCLQALEDGAILPGTPDSQGLCYAAEGKLQPLADPDAFHLIDEDAAECCVLPWLWEADRPVAARMGFIGDSITQGCQTRLDHYEQWAARIIRGLPAEMAGGNVGLGFARAQDAAQNGPWLRKTRGYDVVNLCLGGNDILQMTEKPDLIESLTNDLTTTVSLLRAQGAKVVLFTIPPFSMTGRAETVRCAVNRLIRETRLGADTMFDMEILAIPGSQGQARFGDHPDGLGGALVAGDYLSRLWHENKHLLLK